MTTADEQSISLKQKIGQMLLIGFKGVSLTPQDTIAQYIQAQQIGGVILFDYDFQTKKYHHNIQNPAQLKELTGELERCNPDKSHPLLISIDYEGGSVNRLKEAYGFPATLSAEEIAKKTDNEISQYAARMVETLKKSGINLNFAPVIDVNVNPDNSIIGKLGRSFSANAGTVTHDAAIFSKAYAEQNVLCGYKHFPGHGSSTADSHLGFVDVTNTWHDIELDPYRALIPMQKNCQVIMTAHVVNRQLDPDGFPGSLSKKMTTHLLRDQLGFKGVVVTDDLQMGAITTQYTTDKAIILAINAGADILVFGNQLTPLPQDPAEVIDIIYNAVIQDDIPPSRIDESYERILTLKATLKR